MLAVKRTELLEAGSPKGLVRTGAEQLAAGVPAAQWIACSAGHGAKGRRLYDWTRIQLASPATSEMARWLLVRRSRSDGELAFYACYGPAATPLVGLVQVAAPPPGPRPPRSDRLPDRLATPNVAGQTTCLLMSSRRLTPPRPPRT